MGNTAIWFVGVTIEQDDVELGWMPEGVYATEEEAAEAAREHEFVLMARVGERLPEKAEDAEKIYWPRQEAWEESALYKIQQERAK